MCNFSNIIAIGKERREKWRIYLNHLDAILLSRICWKLIIICIMYIIIPFSKFFFSININCLRTNFKDKILENINDLLTY